MVKLKFSVVALLTSLSLMFALGSCKKKSNGSSGGGDKKEEQIKDSKNTATQPKGQANLGKETREGQSVVYRGSDGIFSMSATPYAIAPGQVVNFAWKCGANNQGRMVWDFGDGTGAQHSSQIAHLYNRAGTYKVKGVCIEGEGVQQSGTLTITVSGTNQNTNVPPYGGAGGSPNGSNPGGNNGGGYQNPNDPNCQCQCCCCCRCFIWWCGGCI